MIGKSHLENKPRRKEQAENPLGRTNFDIFSSSVVSIEGYNFAVVITDDLTGYRWLYGMRSKDCILKVIKKWYSDITELRQLHELVVVMRDNAGENSLTNILCRVPSGATWVAYDKSLPRGSYETAPMTNQVTS
jgi:hypothetical protein